MKESGSPLFSKALSLCVFLSSKRPDLELDEVTIGQWNVRRKDFGPGAASYRLTWGEEDTEAGVSGLGQGLLTWDHLGLEGDTGKRNLGLMWSRRGGRPQLLSAI